MLMPTESFYMTSRAMPYDTLFMTPPESCLSSLPTPDDIDGSEIVIKRDMSASALSVVIEGQFIVKYGTQVVPLEAENMRYVAKMTTVPVLKVYAVYQAALTNKLKTTYIVMEHIAGESLQDLWSSLDEARKTAIAKTLRSYFDELRSLPHPGFFGNITGGRPLDGTFNSFLGSKAAAGSFKTEDELLECMIKIYLLEGGERMMYKAEFYRLVLPDTLRGNGDPVFCHGDFQRKNVIVQDDGKVVLIDWEVAGWYPSYWEYAVSTYANMGWRDDWYKYLAMILDAYPNQMMYLSAMRNEMWC